ncbi:MAG TPA: MFS transporter [Streptosporangiaceae bacterium]
MTAATAAAGRVAAATRAEKLAVYAAGLVQGITLVTFPAASTIFTSRSGYGLSAGQYGLMFVPQVVAAILASLGGARLAGRTGWKLVYLSGLAANLAAMALLIGSRFAESDQPAAYPLLLAATACLGLGFGLTVPAVNTFTAQFHPAAVDRSILVLNALLGLGTALAPVFVAIFTGLGAWVGMPVLAAILLVALLTVSLRLPLRGPQAAGSRRRARLPRLFWLFAAFATLYGCCETLNGNWSQIDLVSLHVPATTAALTLTVFWAMVTAGRVLFAVVQRWVPSRLAYHLLPFVLAAAFVFIALLPAGTAWAGVLAFGLAGLGCSALLPLTISFGQEAMTAVSASVASGVIACYQLGYGFAAFGVGPLRSAGLTLPEIYAGAAGLAVVLGVLSLLIARGRPSPAAVHPRPATHLRNH